MTDRRIAWLKGFLLAKAALCFLFWGLPFLLVPLPLLGRMGALVPSEPMYLRMLGAVITAFGVAYWYGARDPVRNLAIVRAGVVDNALATLVNLYFIFFGGVRSLTMVVSAALVFIFFLAFLLLAPKDTARTG